MIARCVLIELRKLNGSLALLLAIVAPGLLAVLALLAMFSAERAPTWNALFWDFLCPLWAFFLLPMTVTAFTTLVAQIEYKGRAWDHLLALPVARWRIFAAKAIVAFGAVAAMTLLVFLFATITTTVGGALTGRIPADPFPWERIVRVVPAIVASAAFFVALQLWVSLRFANFVTPLVFGISGTLMSLAVVMTRTDKADWFPWVLPVNALRQPDPAASVLIGALGGAVVLALMMFDLSKRTLH